MGSILVLASLVVVIPTISYSVKESLALVSGALGSGILSPHFLREVPFARQLTAPKAQSNQVSRRSTNRFQVGQLRQLSVVDFGATPDDTTNDTGAIVSAFHAATKHSGPTDVIIPPGTYYVQGAMGSPALRLTGNNITVRGRGVLKLIAGDDADCVLELSGAHNVVDGVTIDGNASGNPTGRGDCLYLSGSDNTASEVTCQNSKVTSGIDFLVVGNAVHNTCDKCVSRNAGQNAFDNRGDFTTFKDCVAIDFGHHGLNQAGGQKRQLTIDGLFLKSQCPTATEGIIVDPGAVHGTYLSYLTLKNVRAESIPAANNYVKIARVHHIKIDRLHVRHNEHVPSITFAEGIKDLEIKDSTFSRAINFDESGGVSGEIKNVSESRTTPGRASYVTVQPHRLLVGDTIYVLAQNYSGFQEVLAVTSDTTFESDCAWLGNASGHFYQCTGEVTFDNVNIGDRVHSCWPISGIRTPRFTLRNSRVATVNGAKLIAPKNSYPIGAVERYDIENCFFEFNRGVSDAIVLMGETNGIEYFTVNSDQLHWTNNCICNLATGFLAEPLYSVDGRLLATRAHYGNNFFTSSIRQGDSVTWKSGDCLWNPSATPGSSPGWICTRSGTFATGAFDPMALTNREIPCQLNAASSPDQYGAITCELPISLHGQSGGYTSIDMSFIVAGTKSIKRVRGYCDGLLLYDSGATSDENPGSVMVRLGIRFGQNGVANVKSYVHTSDALHAPTTLVPGPNCNIVLNSTTTIKFVADGTDRSNSTSGRLSIGIQPFPVSIRR